MAHQHLNTKVKNVLAFNQGDYIGGVIQVFDVNRVCARSNLGTAKSWAADVDCRKNIRLGVLQTQSACRVVPFRLGNKPVALLGVGHAELVHHRRANRPGVGILHVVPIYVPGEAVVGA